MTVNKEKYITWAQHQSLTIFAQPWWLNAVAGEHWDVLLYEKSGAIVAALPIYLRRQLGLNTIGMPPLTQHNGLTLLYPAGQKPDTRLKYEKEVLTALGEQLSMYAAYYQHFPYTLTNWLPFYWLKFTQTTRYTYILKDFTELTTVFANFASNIRTDIKKAQKILTVTESENIADFYPLYQMTFTRQDKATQVSAAWLQALDKVCTGQGCRKIYLARDVQGQVHAGVYLVWDDTTVYYLLGGADPKLRNSGATSLLLWQALQFAAQQKKIFDFEGSMLEPVERFVRAFGAEQQPYFVLEKTFSKTLKILKSIRALLN
jgi:hypothetical protein